MGSNVEVRASFSVLVIYINGLAHLRLDRTQLLGFQSWFTLADRSWTIEFYMREGEPIKLVHDDHARWEAILRKLDEVL